MDTTQIIAIIVWSMIIIGTIIVEIAGPQLVSIWFTLGAIVSLILAIFNVDVTIQLIVFVLVSTIALVISKPIYNKYINKNSDQKQDVNSLVGDEGVMVLFLNEENRQYVEIKGARWEIINEETIPVGKRIVVTKVVGNRLEVKEK